MTQQMLHSTELNKIADTLMLVVSKSKSLEPDLEAIKAAANQLTRSFSGSWVGYHSRVYFDDFSIPPAGAIFSTEWGLMMRRSNDSHESWREYDTETVKEHLFKIAEGRSLESGRAAAIEANGNLNNASRDLLSILEVVLMAGSDSFLAGLKKDLQSLKHNSIADIANNWIKRNPIVIRDVRAVNEGTCIPPHFEVAAEVLSIQNAFDVCEEVASIARKAALHLDRKSKLNESTQGSVVVALPPISSLANNVEHIPELVRDDIREADRCYHNQLFNAFGAMARRVVHSICADKEAYEHHSLEAQINDLLGRFIITQEVGERMHLLRKLGRNGAHPEWETVSSEMAKIGWDTMLWLVSEVYKTSVPELPDWPSTKRYKLPKKPPSQ